MKQKNISLTTQNKKLKLLRKLINISGNSAKIKELEVEQPYENHELRPQLHVFISAPFGEFKSKLLREVNQCYKGKIEDDLSFASFVGSIDKGTKQALPAKAWECRNKLLLLDEFTATKRSKVTNALLQLLEGQEYSRKIARYCANTHQEDGNLYFKAWDGNIELKTRFACVSATMKNINKAREYTFKALLSRFVPIRYDLDINDIEQVLDGKKLFKKKSYNPNSTETIPQQDYKDIRKTLKQEYSNLKSRNFVQIYPRAVNDCCRIFAVTGKHDHNLYKDVFRLKARYAP